MSSALTDGTSQPRRGVAGGTTLAAVTSARGSRSTSPRAEHLEVLVGHVQEVAEDVGQPPLGHPAPDAHAGSDISRAEHLRPLDSRLAAGRDTREQELVFPHPPISRGSRP